MKLFARATALLLAALMLLCTLAGCAGTLDPLGYLKDSMERTLTESLGGQILGVLFEAVQGGSLTLDFDGTDLAGGLPDAAHLKLWFDAQNERLAADAALVLAGERFEAQAFVSELEAAVVSPTFFGSNTLGVDFTTLEKDLKTSIFSNHSGTAFSVPTISAAGAARVSAIKDGSFFLLGEAEDGLDTLDEIVEYFLEALSTYATHTRYKKDGSVYISLDINNDSLSRALRATHEMVADDRSVTKYVQRIAATLDSIYSAATGVSGTLFSDKVNYFLNSEADIDALCLAIDEATPFSFLLEARVRAFGMRLEALRVTFLQAGAVRADLSLELAEQGEKNKLSLVLDGVSRELTYLVREDGYRSYAADLSYQMSTQEGVVLSLEGALQADKRAESYALTFKQGEQTCTLAGNYLFENDETMLSVNDVTLDGASKKLSLAFHARAEEKAPEVPSYLNVVKMDVTRFAPIHARATAATAKFLALWGPTAISSREALFDMLKSVGFAA